MLNEEGVIRVRQSFETVSNFDTIAAQLAAGTPVIFPNAFMARGNPTTLFKLREDLGFSIRIVEPFPLQTNFILAKEGSELSIVPSFGPRWNKETDMQADMGLGEHLIKPEVLQSALIDMYLVYLPSGGTFLVWKSRGQIYIPPLPNIHETAQVCLGDGNNSFAAEYTRIEQAEKLLDSFYASRWNPDLLTIDILRAAQRYLRWSPDGEQQMRPMPTVIKPKELRVVGNTQLVELFGAGL